MISLTFLLSADPNVMDILQREHPQGPNSYTTVDVMLEIGSTSATVEYVFQSVEH